MDSISEIMQDNSDDLSQFKNDSDSPTTKSNNKQKKPGSSPQPKQKQKQAQDELEKIKTKQKQTTQNKPEQLKSELQEISSKLDKIIQLLANSKNKNNEQQTPKEEQNQVVEEIEGVFDGQHMIGSDTSKYEVPYEFADEKNLVEGDLLKLNVKGGGGYNYETVEIVDRKRLVGQVVTSEQKWYAQVESDQYRIRGDFIENKNIEEGNKVVILVPKHGKSNWAAIENVF
ncbi:MAG: hypothetical protein ABEJ02_01155 [Candidatus Paceibacteria bacterium]